MKKTGLILIFLILLSSLQAVAYLPAHGSLTVQALEDSVVAYHTFADDQHWYGSDSWAVKFDFTEFQAGYDVFKARGMMIYIPGFQSADEMQIKLCKNNVNQPLLTPDSLLFITTLQPANMNFGDWNIIDFGTIISGSHLWIVVDYPTNPVTQYISASAVSGLHSYYQDDGYYVNMFAAGFQSEFLFSLYGSFQVGDNEVDLDLVGFHWTGDMLPATRIYPVYTIRNTTGTAASGAHINLTLTSPDGVRNLYYEATGEICDSIPLPQIQPFQTITLDYTNELYFELLPVGSQYNFNTTIICPLDNLITNNSYSCRLELFTERRDRIFVENAVALNEYHSTNLLQAQADLIDTENTELVNYYSNYTQTPFYCPASIVRFNYYSLIGNPATIINGSRKILGYNASQYPILFQNFYDDALENDSTYISFDSMSGFYDSSGDVTLNITLANQNNKVLTSFINNSSVYVGITENVINFSGLPEDVNVPVFRLLAAQFNAPTLAFEQSFSSTVQFNFLNDLDLITGDVNNCRLLCWVQNNQTKRVYHVSAIPFTELEQVDIQNSEMPFVFSGIELSPNPFSLNGDLKISFERKESVDKTELKIYNIRGQMIRKFDVSSLPGRHTFFWNGTDASGKQVAGGIYLIRLSTEKAGEKSMAHRKCLLLNR